MTFLHVTFKVSRAAKPGAGVSFLGTSLQGLPVPGGRKGCGALARDATAALSAVGW